MVNGFKCFLQQSSQCLFWLKENRPGSYLILDAMRMHSFDNFESGWPVTNLFGLLVQRKRPEKISRSTICFFFNIYFYFLMPKDNHFHRQFSPQRNPNLCQTALKHDIKFYSKISSWKHMFCSCSDPKDQLTKSWNNAYRHGTVVYFHHNCWQREYMYFLTNWLLLTIWF